jgi:hypothetical protein
MVAAADELLDLLGLSGEDLKRVHAGKVVRGTLTSNGDREIGCYVACIIDAPPVGLIEDIFMTSSQKVLTDDAVSAIGNIIEGDISEFEGISFGQSAAKAYKNATPGSDLNLSAAEIAEFQKLKKSGASHADVEMQFRKVLYERYLAYREHGLQGIEPYCRSGNKDFQTGEELREKCKKGYILKREAPEVYQYWLDYPKNKPAGLVDSFSWQSSVIDENVTVALVHKMGLRQETGYMFVQRHFYVSRSHNSVVGTGGAFPVGGNKTALAYAARTSTDRVSGFGGKTKRAVGAKIMSDRIAENIENLRKSVS